MSRASELLEKHGPKWTKTQKKTRDDKNTSIPKNSQTTKSAHADKDAIKSTRFGKENDPKKTPPMSNPYGLRRN